MIADILSSYVNHDVASISDFKKSTEAWKLIKLLAVRVGNKVDISKISVVAGMPRQAVENFLELFEQSYLIRTIPVTITSPDREIVKSRKLYFLDNGIAALSAELSSGSKFENAVFNQLHHFGDIAYYSLKTGNEIDFILDKKMAFEVKESPLGTDLNTTAALSKKIGIEQNFVVGRHANHRFKGFLWGGDIR